VSPHERADRARARARARSWAPTRERVESLIALTDLFAGDDVRPDGAIDASAIVLAELLGDAVFIALLSRDRSHMHVLGAHHPDPAVQDFVDSVTGLTFRADEGFSARVVDTGEALLIPSVSPAEMAAVQPHLAAVSEELGTRGFIVAPLVLGRGGCSGFVWQVRTRAEPPLDEDGRRFLSEVATQLALCVENWRPGEALDLAVPTEDGLDAVLTTREREVLQRLAQGQTDHAIAAGLGLSPRTVEWYRQRIQARLGVRTRGELIAIARQRM
jgi:DNA-binding CsgD family transcriptional regulator